MLEKINIKRIFIGIVFSIILLSSQVLYAKTIEVGTIERPPFATKKANGEWSGMSIDIWKEIADRNSLKYSFVEFTNFKEMIDSVKSKKLDTAIANISITSEREKDMDYSQPIYDSGLQIMIPKKASGGSFLKVIWESGIIMFLGFALLTLLVIAHILWFFERGKESHRHDYFRDDYLGGIWDAFWWAFIIMTMGGFENEVPSSKISRFLAMFWIVASLFFISTLTAKITTSLTLAELKSDISSYQDLAGKRVGVSKSSTAEEFLNNTGVLTIGYNNFDNLKKDLLSGKLDAVVQDAPVLNFYANHEGKGKVLVVGEMFKPEKYGILLPEGSALKEIIDRTLIKMQEDGTYKKIKEKYFGPE